MSRTYSSERVAVAQAYPGKKWTKKVLEMDDAQVHEIFVRLQNQRKTVQNSHAKMNENHANLHANMQI